MRNIVIFCIAFAWICLPSGRAQTSATTVVPLFTEAAFGQLPAKEVGREEQISHKRRRTLGFGISTTDGDATTGKQSFMLSALYAYKLFPAWDIEIALQQTSMTKWYPGNFFAVSSALSQDITMLTAPIIGLPNFRLGIGSALRWQQSAVSSSRSIFDPVTGTYFSLPAITPQNTFAVGGALKIEYVFAIAPVLDISIRAQGHIYAPPTVGENNHAPGGTGGAASLGVFFLIHP